jgi:hypothetical protein
MLLPFAEASLILDMFGNGSLPKTAAASTVAEKLRRAVVFAGSDRHAIIQLYCWQAEAELLLRARANAAPGVEPGRP